MRSRYYDPASGRFTQDDPIGLAGGLSLYGFANGDPVNFSAPLAYVHQPYHQSAGRPARYLVGPIVRHLAFRQPAAALRRLRGTS